MIKIISGKYGPKLLGPGTVLNLDAVTEKRMVSKKVAEYIGEQDNFSTENDKNNINIMTFDQLKKVRSKKELIQYAETVGIHNLNENSSKDNLIDSIANYLDENFNKE